MQTVAHASRPMAPGSHAPGQGINSKPHAHWPIAHEIAPDRFLLCEASFKEALYKREAACGRMGQGKKSLR